MARTGINFDEVCTAAEALLGRGLNPTIQRVREYLGTGSNTTISTHLKIWQQQLAQAPKIILPPAVPEAVALALDAFWKIAVQHAEAAFANQRDQAEHAIATAEQARDRAVTEQRQAQEEADQLRQGLEAARATARELADRLLIEQERRTAAEVEIQAAVQRAQDAAATVLRIRADAAHRMAQLEATFQQARTDLEQQRAEAEQRLQTEQQRSAVSEARFVALLEQLRLTHSAERQEFASERQDWHQRQQQWIEQQAVWQRETATLQAERAAATEREHGLTTELAQVHQQIEAVQTQHLAALSTAEALRGELTAVRAERDRLHPRSATGVQSPAHPDPTEAGTAALPSPSPPRPRRTRTKPAV